MYTYYLTRHHTDKVTGPYFLDKRAALPDLSSDRVLLLCDELGYPLEVHERGLVPPEVGLSAWRDILLLNERLEPGVNKPDSGGYGPLSFD